MEAATIQDVGQAQRFEREPKEVSVICTAKNAASTIERTIQSTLAQDVQNWEMIIVDDGSTDGTVSVVHSAVRADPRIRLISTGGVGRGRALNRAFAEAQADLIANIDADDESHPCRLRYQLEAMKRHPELAVVATNWVRVDGAANPVWQRIDAGASFAVEEVTSALALSNPICHSSAMMRKAAIVGLGGYDEARRFMFDYDLWVRLAGAGLRLGRIRLALVAKRIHPGQSYLHSARLSYLLASGRLQWRAMQVLGVGGRYMPLIALRILWGILPLSVRLRLSDLGARVGWTRTQ